VPETVSAPASDLLTSLLRDVSRSFHLTLRILPAAVRPQIGLAYLLARTTDTIADTDVIPVAGRLAALDGLRQRILKEGAGTVLDFGELAGRQALPAERRLLERVEEALAVLNGFPLEDQRRIREVLTIITGGQELDLRRFGEAGIGRVVALHAPGDLDDYTYRVAGCVGEFWTRMCVAHVFPVPKDPEDPAAPADWFETAGIRFGKGLQLINILRDLPRDLRQGRCYLPSSELAGVGLQPADLLVPSNEVRARPVYDRWLSSAERHLAAGWRYTLAIPSRCYRLRLACAWPLLIGVRTATLLRAGPVLDPERRIKVSRPEIRRILVGSLMRLPFRRRWERLFREAQIG
jgi:farnesyl-diphosphate farnesyltransferase